VVVVVVVVVLCLLTFLVANVLVENGFAAKKNKNELG